MKNVIQRVPVPLCGVMLGTAALGNLLQSYSEGIRYACGIFAGILLILAVLKIIMFPDKIKEDMKNPIMASVAATFPMGLMLLSAYVKPWIGQTAFFIWAFAVVLHVCLILYFTMKFMAKLQMPKVFASYFIVYVGIAAAAVTAPSYGMEAVGTAAFWFAFVCLIALLFLVTYRYVKFREVPEPAKALICIYAAPASLCAAGYVQSVAPKSLGLLTAMLVLATVLYVFSLAKAVSFFKLPFYPSMAALTFPFVISAIAAKQAMTCAAKLGSPMTFLEPVVLIETIIAVIFVVYVYVRFMGMIFSGKK